MTLRCLVEKTELGMYYFKIYFFILQNLPRKFSIEIAPNLVFFFLKKGSFQSNQNLKPLELKVPF